LPITNQSETHAPNRIFFWFDGLRFNDGLCIFSTISGRIRYAIFLAYACTETG